MESTPTSLDALNATYQKVCSEIGEKYVLLISIRRDLRNLLQHRDALIHRFQVHQDLAKTETSIDV